MKQQNWRTEEEIAPLQLKNRQVDLEIPKVASSERKVEQLYINLEFIGDALLLQVQ